MSVENKPEILKSTHPPSPSAGYNMVVDSLEGKDDNTLSLDCEPEISTSVKNNGQAALDSMLNHLAESEIAPFKSQQQGDPDLDFAQKKEIAEDLLKHNPAQFLAKFGQFLLEDDLDYFASPGDSAQSYEVDFHVKRLRRYFCKSKNKVDVRNRRYEALKKLVEEGVYFREEEMKKRNPLLYEQMIGQFLTPEEKEELRRRESTKNDRSYVLHLMGQIEEHYVNCLKKKQMDDEDEEMDTDDEEELVEEEEVESNRIVNSDDNIEEFDTDSDNEDSVPCRRVPKRRKIDDEEKLHLREEFITNMYESFLEGRDIDFDYSKIDSNPEYESTVLRTHDEEEKYFDSETPELVCSEDEGDGNAPPGAAAAVEGGGEEEEEEDELDKFMKTLKPDEALNECIENVKPAEST